MRIAFYVSGHGFGHASRVNAVIRELYRLEPRAEAHVRTRAPKMMFDSRVVSHEVAIDADVVESADALCVDTAATAQRTAEFFRNADALVQDEVQWIRRADVRVVVADIPTIAGEIAAASNVPCIGMGNFLWDWILEELADSATLHRMREGYRAFDQILRLPFSHDEGWNVCHRVSDVALVASRTGRPREEVRRELGLERERVVLIGGRARLDDCTRERLLSGCPEYRFLTADTLPSFGDLICASDIVVSKIGYSIAAECIAEGVRLLYPPREGFREEEVVRREAPRYFPALAIPREE